VTTTPQLVDVVASIENAETFLVAAVLGEELPASVAGLAGLKLRIIRETLEFHVRR
jgi:hypothetical protein